MPVHLSDSELDAVMAAAQPLEPSRRDAFLQQVAAQLQGRQIGPGLVHRVCAEVQRWAPRALFRAEGHLDQVRVTRLRPS